MVTTHAYSLLLDDNVGELASEIDEAEGPNFQTYFDSSFWIPTMF